MWSASYALAKTLEQERNIPSFSFYGKLADCCSLIFSLIHPVDEFSFKKMRMWGQSKISSCCICVWCKSREIGGKGGGKVSPQTFLPTVKVRVRVNFEILYIALTKSRSARRASYQSVFMDSCMAVCLTRFCPVYLDFYYEDSY